MTVQKDGKDGKTEDPLQTVIRTKLQQELLKQLILFYNKKIHNQKCHC
jgi:hypothetical protein